MSIREIEAKSILRKHRRIESWFISRFGMNLYRGCMHNCSYCDGRDERYYVEGEFGRDIVVKTNALEVLRRELDPARRRKPIPGGFVFAGGGVTDLYQPIETKYGLARGALELLLEFGRPTHVLTKSTLVERDLDLVQAIDRKSRAIVSMSFSTTDDELARLLEPGVRPPSERLASIRRMVDAGITCGVYNLPIVPFLSDRPEQIDTAFGDFAAAGVSFVVAGGMTLKEGRQKEHFLRVVGSQRAEAAARIAAIYPSIGRSPYGEPIDSRGHYLDPILLAASKKHRLPLRPPIWLVDPDSRVLGTRDRVVVTLEHIAYALDQQDIPNPFGRAAHSIAMAKLDEPDSNELPDDADVLARKVGVGSATARLVSEIVRTGSSRRYRELLEPWAGVELASLTSPRDLPHTMDRHDRNGQL